jgi:hypothetical protein
VRLKPADADIKNMPSTINLAGSKATLRILKPDEINQLGTSCVPERPSEYRKRRIENCTADFTNTSDVYHSFMPQPLLSLCSESKRPTD